LREKFQEEGVGVVLADDLTSKITRAMECLSEVSEDLRDAGL
jgi:hypothetical protein